MVEAINGGSGRCGSADLLGEQSGSIGYPTTMNDPRDIALAAAELVSGERQKEYGHALDNFGRAAKIWEVILGCEVSAENVALCMIGMKLAREVHLSKPDTVIDGIGYFLTLSQVREERLRRESEKILP